MHDVVALGELLIDFTPAGRDSLGDQLFARKPGGAPANVLAALVRLGGTAAFIGKVGEDKFGQYLAATLQSLNIDISGLMFDAQTPTSLAFVHLNEDGDRSFSFYRKPGADLMLHKEEVRKALIEACRVLHIGSISLTGEPSRSATLEAVAYAKRLGKIISFDPNYRPLLWDQPDTALEQIQNGLRWADIVKVSEEELALLFGHTDPLACSTTLIEQGVTLVLVSLGKKGAFYRIGSLYGYVPTYDVNTVDTNGAGDAFLGAVLYRLQGRTLSDIANLTREDLEEIVLFANAAGSIATTRNGSIPAMPTLQQIAACQAEVPLLLLKA